MTYRIAFKFASANSAGYLTFVGDMPQIKGSEKQVAWAGDIRATFAREVAEFIAKAVKVPVGVVIESDTAFIAETEAALAAKLAADPGAGKVMGAIAKVLDNDSAKFWIENVRNRHIRTVVQEAMER